MVLKKNLGVVNRARKVRNLVISSTETKRPKESKVIAEWMVKRIKRGLGVNAIIVGPPGLGKSYLCMRLMEQVYEILNKEKLLDPKHIVYNIPDAFGFVQGVKRRGEPLTVEEVSVLASSRRAMAADNVSLNYLLDTVRKKQIVLLMNAPHLKSVDKHIQRMSHLTIECLRINKHLKFSTVKAFKLQSSQDTGKVYKHRFSDAGREVHRCHFYPPSKELSKLYEEQKDKFMSGLYQTMQSRTQKIKDKSDKDAGLGKVEEMIKTATQNEIMVYQLTQRGKSLRDIGKILGVSHQTVSGHLQRYKNKTKIVDSGPKPPENKPVAITN